MVFPDLTLLLRVESIELHGNKIKEIKKFQKLVKKDKNFNIEVF